MPSAHQAASSSRRRRPWRHTFGQLLMAPRVLVVHVRSAVRPQRRRGRSAFRRHIRRRSLHRCLTRRSRSTFRRRRRDCQHPLSTRLDLSALQRRRSRRAIARQPRAVRRATQTVDFHRIRSLSPRRRATDANATFRQSNSNCISSTQEHSGIRIARLTCVIRIFGRERRTTRSTLPWGPDDPYRLRH
jgi:hypothetical protein